MKNSILCCLVMLTAAASAVAQSDGLKKNTSGGFYGRLDVGYTMPHAANYYYSEGYAAKPLSGSQSFVPANGLRTVDFSKASFTSGTNVTIGGGYMFNPYIGVDLGVRVGVAPKKNIYTYDQSDTLGNINLDGVYTTHSQIPIYIMPSIVLSTGNNNPFSAYIRAGIGFPVGGRLIENYTSTNYITDNVYEEEAEYDLYMSKAMCGALGFNYRLGSNLNIYGEVNGMSLTNYAKTRTVTLATLNGADQLGTFLTYQKETEYHSGYTYDPATQTAAKPSQAPAASMPASNIGVSVGARLTFADLGIRTIRDSNDHGKGYLRGGVDFSMPHAGNFFIADGYTSRPISGTETYYAGSGSTTIDVKKASYGSGLGVTIGGGYMFTPHFGVDLGVDVGVSPKKYTYTYQESDLGGNITIDDSYRSYFSTPVLISPSIVISTGNNRPFNVYARAGLAFPVGGMFITENTFTTPTSTITVEEQYKCGMSKGLTGALGVQQRINSSFGLFGEFGGMSLTRYAKSSEITSYTIDGVDQLPLLNINQSQAVYNSSYTSTPPVILTAPAQTNSFPLSFSRAQVRFGARLIF